MRIKSNDIFYEPHLRVTRSIENVLPSKKSYVIQLSLRLKEFPICDVEGSREIITRKVDTVTLIRFTSCKLTFALGSSQISIDVFNTDIFWKSGYNITFLGNVYEQDIEQLSKWVHNRTLSIGLKTVGLAKVDESIVEFDLELIHNQFKLGPDEFESSFLKNTGLNYSYIREFEVSSPVINNLSARPALHELYVHISNLQNNLEHALRVLRQSGDALEVLVLIRQPLDSLRALKTSSTLIADISKDLYISTKILEDLDLAIPGAEGAAKEVVKDLFQLFDVLFDISSKAFHTKIKGSPQTYKMSPGYLEAEFSLTLALNITNYLINRIKASCV